MAKQENEFKKLKNLISKRFGQLNILNSDELVETLRLSNKLSIQSHGTEQVRNSDFKKGIATDEDWMFFSVQDAVERKRASDDNGGDIIDIICNFREKYAEYYEKDPELKKLKDKFPVEKSNNKNSLYSKEVEELLNVFIQL